MTGLLRITLQDEIVCATRELQLRHEVYARRVRKGQMRQETADFQIACMEAILARLRQIDQDQKSMPEPDSLGG